MFSWNEGVLAGDIPSATCIARRLLCGVALLAGTGCADDASLSPAFCAAPLVLTSSVSANPTNVLSAVVTAQVDVAADSVAVRFAAASNALDSLAPAVVPQGGDVVVPVLGLLADTEYTLRAVVYGACGESAGDMLTFTTGPLPDDLPAYTTTGSDPSPGFIVFAAGTYGLVIDNTGRVVWYHRFSSGPGLNFQAQPNGNYTARPPNAQNEIGAWLEIDPLGTVTRSLGCARGLQPRFHDLIAQPDGSWWVLCDEVRTLDLSAIGGPSDAAVLATVAQHLDSAGAPLFEWSTFDHFDAAEIAELDAGDRDGPRVNWTHGNALDLDADGHLLLSFRSLSEVAKIDTETGAVRWRLGGPRNEFTFDGTAEPPFARQHGVRAVAPGTLVLLDNLGDPATSRAERYVLDESARRARLVASFAPSASAVVALQGGTTQPLPRGRLLVAYGNGGRVEEYDATGTVVWRIEGNPGYIFRAQRIQSLYRPGVGGPR